MGDELSAPGSTDLRSPPEGRLPRSWLLVVLATALVRLLWVAVVPAERQLTLYSGGDNEGYRAMAEHLLDGHGLVDTWNATGRLEPSAITVPGQVLYIALVYRLTGRDIQHVRLVNILLELGTCWLLMFLVGSVTGSTRRSAAAGLLYALWPVAILFAADWNTNCLSAFTMTLAAAAHERWRHRGWRGGALVGLLTGIASMVRPAAVILPLALVWRGLDAERPWRGAARYLVAAGIAGMVTISPWVIRNAVVMGQPVLFGTQSSYVLYLGWHDQGIDDPESKRTQLRYDRELGQIGMQQAYADAAWREVRSDPGRAARLAVVKVFRLWLHLFMRRDRVMHNPLFTLCLGLPLLVVLLGLWQGRLPPDYRREAAVLMALVTVGHVLTYAGGVFTIPFYPILLPAAAAGLTIPGSSPTIAGAPVGMPHRD